MEEIINEILEQVKKIIKLNDASRDDEIKMYIRKIINKITNIINSPNLPPELKNIVFEYSLNCTIYNMNGYGMTENKVSSVSDNGQSVSFKQIGGIMPEDVNLDSFIDKKINEISKFVFAKW